MRYAVVIVLLVACARCDMDGWDEDPAWDAPSFNESAGSPDLVWVGPDAWDGLNESAGLVPDGLNESATLGEQLSLFFKEAFGTNSTSDEGPWTVVSFITLLPLRCSEVQNIVSWFDSALQTANPGVQLSSVAQRLGVSTCDAHGCPCESSRRYATRVLEVRSRSTAKALRLPGRETFPYHVETGGSI